MREPVRADSLDVKLNSDEKAVLELFRSASPKLRFAQMRAFSFRNRARSTAVLSLVRKGILARLGEGGEYWLTDRGLQLLDVQLVA